MMIECITKKKNYKEKTCCAAYFFEKMPYLLQKGTVVFSFYYIFKRLTELLGFMINLN